MWTNVCCLSKQTINVNQSKNHKILRSSDRPIEIRRAHPHTAAFTNLSEEVP